MGPILISIYIKKLQAQRLHDRVPESPVLGAVRECIDGFWHKDTTRDAVFAVFPRGTRPSQRWTSAKYMYDEAGNLTQRVETSRTVMGRVFSPNCNRSLPSRTIWVEYGNGVFSLVVFAKSASYVRSLFAHEPGLLQQVGLRSESIYNPGAGPMWIGTRLQGLHADGEDVGTFELRQSIIWGQDGGDIRVLHTAAPIDLKRRRGGKFLYDNLNGVLSDPQVHYGILPEEPVAGLLWLPLDYEGVQLVVGSDPTPDTLDTA